MTLKHIFDFILALLLLIPALFLIFIAAVIIRIETPGSPIFKQIRVGYHGKYFTLYKLRTMHVSTANKASHEIAAANITSVGHFLRKSKIDELPQILSILTGDMSFVGPRPCLPVQEELVELRRTRGALNVRPGITGPAQIMGVDMSTPDKLSKIDADYAQENSFIEDLKIIIATASGSGRGDAANK